LRFCGLVASLHFGKIGLLFLMKQMRLNVDGKRSQWVHLRIKSMPKNDVAALRSKKAGYMQIIEI